MSALGPDGSDIMPSEKDELIFFGIMVLIFFILLMVTAYDKEFGNKVNKQSPEKHQSK